MQTGYVHAFQFPDGRSFHLYQGSLTEVKADALVSSDDNFLSAGGGVSAALAKVAGPVVAMERRRIAGGPRPALGEVVRTSGGGLPCRFLYHAITIDFERGSFQDEQSLRRLVASLFARAREDGATSMALPALGTGAAGFPLGRASEILVDELVARIRDSPVRRVVLALLGDEAERHFYENLVRAAASRFVVESLRAREHLAKVAEEVLPVTEGEPEDAVVEQVSPLVDERRLRRIGAGSPRLVSGLATLILRHASAGEVEQELLSRPECFGFRGSVEQRLMEFLYSSEEKLRLALGPALFRTRDLRVMADELGMGEQVAPAHDELVVAILKALGFNMVAPPQGSLEAIRRVEQLAGNLKGAHPDASALRSTVQEAGLVLERSNPHRPRAFGGKGAEGMKKEILSNRIDLLFLMGRASISSYHRPMKPTRTLSLAAALMLAIVSATADAGEYRGKVGKLPAVFSLEWSADGTVTGTYSHPSRPGKSYRLLGNNAEAGKLYLEEYTGSTLSAKCYLTKKLTDGAVVWSGEMRNTDGRVLAMELSRSREATRSPAAGTPVAAATPAGGAYFGETGGTLTEISLEWGEGGAVNGTCLYPSRPGKVYRLTGRNPAEGRLDLEERLGDTVTARAALKKRITYNEVVWEGRLATPEGREVPVWFARTRKKETEDLTDWEDERALFGRLERNAEWVTFPDARKPVEMVPVNWDYSHNRFPGKITHFENRPGSTLLKIRVGVGWSQPDFTGPEITLHHGRSLPLPPEQLIGKRVSLVFSDSGALREVNLHSVAMTHWRKGPDGLVEIRGVLGSRLLDELDLLTPAEKTALLTAMDPVSFVPDKFATDPGVALDFPFREIRLLAQYGTVVQTTGAGPGGLELESISLETAPPAENPWIFVGDRDPGTEMPRFQWTEEAG